MRAAAATQGVGRRARTLERPSSARPPPPQTKRASWAGGREGGWLGLSGAKIDLGRKGAALTHQRPKRCQKMKLLGACTRRARPESESGACVWRARADGCEVEGGVLSLSGGGGGGRAWSRAPPPDLALVVRALCVFLSAAPARPYYYHCRRLRRSLHCHILCLLLVCGKLGILRTHGAPVWKDRGLILRLK